MSEQQAKEVAQIFTDGGCIGSNPSKYGLTWAYVLVAADGSVIAEKSGLYTTADWTVAEVENNAAETVAIVHAFDRVPDDWEGELLGDNLNALRRASGECQKFARVPGPFVEAMVAHQRRLGRWRYKLLGGHPTKADLARGARTDGKPVSPHNVRCDELVQAEAAKYLNALAVHKTGV